MSTDRLRRWLPMLGFWQGRQALVADLLAGLTVGLVLVPQAMAYAALAGMPPIYGLYAGSFACMAGALFGRCPQLQTGPVAMTSLLSFAAVAPLAAPGGEDFIALMAILALMVGVLRIAIGLLKGAALAALISKPVLIGFGTAAGIIIAATQMPKLFLIDPELENPVFNAVAILGRLDEVHLPTLLMGAGTLAAMILFKRFAPRWPGLLISLAAAGVVSWAIGFEAMQGTIVGALPSGLPPLVIPDEGWRHAPALLGGALLVVVIGLLEVMTVTGAAERMHGRPTDLNGELVGQGAASLVAGVTSGFPVSGSLSRSSLNLIAGARTGLSSVISGLVVLLTLLVFTPLLEPLPYPALAAAIVMAVAALVRPFDLLRTWRVRRSDALFGFATLVATLLAAPDMVLGMAVGVSLSVGYGLWQWMHPRVVITAPSADGRHAAAADQSEPAANLRDGRLVVRVDSRVGFLNARLLGERLGDWARGCPEGTVLVLDACAINDLDATGVDMLVDLAATLAAGGKQLALADVKAPVRRRLAADERLAAVPLLARTDSPLATGTAPS